MASDRRRPAGLVAFAALCSLAASLVLSPARVAAAAPWWRPVGLQGQAITAVGVAGTSILVRTAAGLILRADGPGLSFAPAPGDFVPAAGPVRSADQTWAIGTDGYVDHATAEGSLVRDPGSPDLGAAASLIAAPAAVPGVVVAVAADGTVWRRGQDGGWARGLLLLPAGLPRGVPRITAVAAFNEPLSDTVYLATDGYSVLNSADGGDDWFRAGPGLPDSVYALATDPGRRWVLAGTSNGLWVHELQALPAPPVYSDAALVGRWIGTVLVSIAAAAAAALALRRALRQRV